MSTHFEGLITTMTPLTITKGTEPVRIKRAGGIAEQHISRVQTYHAFVDGQLRILKCIPGSSLRGALSARLVDLIAKKQGVLTAAELSTLRGTNLVAVKKNHRKQNLAKKEAKGAGLAEVEALTVTDPEDKAAGPIDLTMGSTLYQRLSLNPVHGPFGAVVNGKHMIEGHLIMETAVPNVEELSRFSPSAFRAFEEDREGRTLGLYEAAQGSPGAPPWVTDLTVAFRARRSRLQPAVIQYLKDDELAALIDDINQAREKNRTGEAGGAADTMPTFAEVIPANMSFVHLINIKSWTQHMDPVVYSVILALDQLREQPYLGGRLGDGHGRVQFQYYLVREGSRLPLFEITETGECLRHPKAAELFAAAEAWFASLTWADLFPVLDEIRTLKEGNAAKETKAGTQSKGKDKGKSKNTDSDKRAKDRAEEDTEDKDGQAMAAV